MFLAKRTRTTPAVTINIAIRAGSECDPADAPGAMYLLSRLIDKEAAAVLRYTLELPPGLAGTVWQDKYEALLRECQR